MLLRYVVAWLLAAGAAVAVALIVLADAPDPVSLPPVRQAGLVSAARAAGCDLAKGRRVGDVRPAQARAAQKAPLDPGAYRRPPGAAAVAAAARRGIVVIQYRPDLSAARLEELLTVQRSVPRGTAVAPSGASARADVAATAWRRRLTCRRFGEGTLDALRLFVGRYVGTGPDR